MWKQIYKNLIKVQKIPQHVFTKIDSTVKKCCFKVVFIVSILFMTTLKNVFNLILPCFDNKV